MDHAGFHRPLDGARFNKALDWVIMALSAGVAVLGVILAAGWVQLRGLPDRYRLIVAAVVFLYGVYRFVLAFLRNQRRHP